MSNVERCLNDGYSTGGTAGTGLGAVRRLSADFDIHSVPGEGTVVMSRVGTHPGSRFGAVSIPMKGETECGDSWALAEDQDSRCLMLVDGLGHGSFAATAAERAQESFAASVTETPHSMLERAHRALASTRGAAAAIARITQRSKLSYAGVGNITGYVVGADRSQGLVSYNGTLGVALLRLRQFEYEWPNDSLLVMHSDGLSARWDLRKNPMLRGKHPAVIAGVLYRDHARPRDDATVVVLN